MKKLKSNKKIEKDKSFLIAYCLGNLMLSVLYILPFRMDKTEIYNTLCLIISVILILNTAIYFICKVLKVDKYPDIVMLAVSTFLNVSALYFLTVHYVFKSNTIGSLYIYLVCIAYSLGSRILFKSKFLEDLQNVSLIFIKLDVIFSSVIFIIYFFLSLTSFKTTLISLNVKLLVINAALLVGCCIVSSILVSGYFKKKYNISFKNNEGKI